MEPKTLKFFLLLIQILKSLDIIFKVKTPPIFICFIHSEIHPIPIFIYLFLKNIFIIFRCYSIPKDNPLFVNKTLFKSSTKSAQKLIKYTVQSRFE